MDNFPFLDNLHPINRVVPPRGELFTNHFRRFNEIHNVVHHIKRKLRLAKIHEYRQLKKRGIRKPVNECSINHCLQL